MQEIHSCYNSKLCWLCTQMHLFDIDIPGKIKFKESVTLTGGSELFTFDTGILQTQFFFCFFIYALLQQSGVRLELVSVVTLDSLS